MADISKLEQQKSFADEYGDRIAEWELFAVALICKELGRIGKMTNGYKGYKTEDKYDICPECMRKIIEFLKEEQNHE